MKELSDVQKWNISHDKARLPTLRRRANRLEIAGVGALAVVPLGKL